MKKNYTFDDLENILQIATDRIESFAKVPDDLFLLKPGSGSWSADEICRHLVRFNNLYIRQMDYAYENALKKPEANGTFHTGYISHLLIRFIEPPYKFKLKTLAPMYPAESNQTPHEVRKALTGTVNELRKRVADYRADNLDLNKIKGRNPVFRFVTMSILEFILYLDAHQRRHFWQIEQTLLNLSGERY